MLKIRKNQSYENKKYKSTSSSPDIATLGTIEKDASEHYGSFNIESIFAKKAIDKLIEINSWQTCLDVGAGLCNHSNYIKSKTKEKKVYTCDLDVEGGDNCRSEILEYDYLGDFLDIDFDQKFDCVYTLHTLEHQQNVYNFLKKIKKVTKEKGIICIVVPIRKPFIISGHLTLWNAGLVLYNLVNAGIDCSKYCKILQYDYNICVIVKNISFDIQDLDLKKDSGDLRILYKYFPESLQKDIIEYDCFNGDIFELNWNE